MSETLPAGPLAGVRVIDLTAVVMGPYCTQIMADMGADVVKVEPPAGDNARYISVGPASGMSGVFVNVNRGKRSVVLDLKTDDGKAALRGLVADADVFIHSMRVKAIDELGFGYGDVAAINPDVVYTNCVGYSRRGPDADRPAYDDVIQAQSGVAAVQEMLTGEAAYFGTIVADKVAGLTALYATMMALFHRERTGEGQEVEVSMFETMASFMLVEHANGAMFDPPLGPAFYPRTVAPNRKPYATKDGHVAVLLYNDKQWRAFIGAVQPAWNDDSYATLEQRSKQIDVVYGLIAQTLLERTTAEWLELFLALEIPAAPIQAPARPVRRSATRRLRPVRDGADETRAGALSRCAHLVFADTRGKWRGRHPSWVPTRSKYWPKWSPQADATPELWQRSYSRS